MEPLGGQNLLEPAACTCPVVLRPYTFDFAQAAELACAAGAAQRVPDMAQAMQVATALAHNAPFLELKTVTGRAVFDSSWLVVNLSFLLPTGTVVYSLVFDVNTDDGLAPLKTPLMLVR